MISILVNIDAGKDKCGNCQALGHVDLHGCGKMEDPSCGIFNEDLGKSADGGAYRSESCIKAQVSGVYENI